MQRDRHQIDTFGSRVPFDDALAVILAAGSASRFVGPRHKLLTDFRGQPLYLWAVHAALAGGLPVLLVWGGAGDPPPELIALDNVDIVVNHGFRDGQATSLACAIDWTTAHSHLEHIVIGLADQPLIPAEAWRRVGADRTSPISAATYDGKRRNPVRIERSLWSELPRIGDEGARVLLRSRQELVTLVACPGNPADIDTIEDLATWNSPTTS